MVEDYEAIKAEFENMETVLSEFPEFASLDKLSPLELAGVATLLHNFYNGIENILKQCLIRQKTSLPAGPTWHRDLIETACESKIISPETTEEIKQYLAFRHFAQVPLVDFLRLFNWKIPFCEQFPLFWIPTCSKLQSGCTATILSAIAPTVGRTAFKSSFSE